MNFFRKNRTNEGIKWDSETILNEIEKLKPWWHKIDLGNGIITPGGDYEWVWEPILRMMDQIDYTGKKVLDLGSWDGMWAFEAEKRGASLVVATDIRIQGFKNLLFAKAVLKSDVIPLLGVNVQNLENRLAIVGMPEEYDIVQHFGLFYHLRDPLLALSQCRRILSDEGLLLLETVYIDDDEKSYMMFSGLPGQYHFYGSSDTWAPTKRCLREVLIRTLFQPIDEDKWQHTMHPQPQIEERLGRISIMAKVMSKSEGNKYDLRKIFGSQ